MTVQIALPRRKPFNMTLRKVGAKNAPEPKSSPDPRIDGAFEVLGWTADERTDWLKKHESITPAEMLSALNAEIDARNSVEA